MRQNKDEDHDETNLSENNFFPVRSGRGPVRQGGDNVADVSRGRGYCRNSVEVLVNKKKDFNYFPLHYSYTILN